MVLFPGPHQGIVKAMKTAGDLLASNLKSIRKERKWTQEMLAEKAGITLNTVQRAEGRLRFPREDNLTALATALGVPESRLFHDPDLTSLPHTPQDCFQVVSDVFHGATAGGTLQARIARLNPDQLADLEVALGTIEQPDDDDDDGSEESEEETG
jgi:transcriptional regulator with XRE-family HTH domain